MSMLDLSPPTGGWRWADRVRRVRDWLDARGTLAWAAAVAVSFVLAWPVGLALLVYTIWSNRMFGRQKNELVSRAAGWGRSQLRDGWEDRMRSIRTAARPSGNAAFDAYKLETLRRLEEEQHSFEDFLARLRDAKDKAEFDQFMDDRSRRAADRTPQDGDPA
ncbi:DUF2852 domain-containing protein [Rubellimicrobium arenae]|uniref:DUF2852 domain-containing protein n=1 Tax=Rubellimicrobium arenae TaxID=2817372 RepID=UPI001FEF66D2|nr:DUF2852 domain-containing protein [Rubellimicrobium arenae]